MNALDDLEAQPRLDRRERIDRARARAWALQIHYKWESGGHVGSLRDTLVETTGTRRIAPRRLPFVRALLIRIDENLPEIDGAIDSALDNWSFAPLGDRSRGAPDRGRGAPLR